jgi:hypothetical protein
MIRRTIVALAWLSCGGACEPKAGTTTPDDGAAQGDGSDAAEGPDDGEAEPAKEPLVEQVLRIEGGIREPQVKQVIEKHFREIRECWDAGLAANPQAELDGAIVVAISVDAAGKVTDAKTELNETGDDTTEECIVAEVGKWTFPKPKGAATIHYPFYLRSY